jgi:hypothetical protein
VPHSESGLAAVVATRTDGSPAVSVVNAGVLDHPVTNEPVVAFVARGGANKLPQLRARPRVTMLFRSGWDWVAVEGEAQLAGPDDELVGLEAGDVPYLLRAVYAAAVGGRAEDWVGLDEEMAAEHHTAVLVRPVRVYSSPAE